MSNSLRLWVSCLQTYFTQELYVYIISSCFILIHCTPESILSQYVRLHEIVGEGAIDRCGEANKFAWRSPASWRDLLGHDGAYTTARDGPPPVRTTNATPLLLQMQQESQQSPRSVRELRFLRWYIRTHQSVYSNGGKAMQSLLVTLRRGVGRFINGCMDSRRPQVKPAGN